MLNTLWIAEDTQGKQAGSGLPPDAAHPQGLEHRRGLQGQQGITRSSREPWLATEVCLRQH